MSIFPTRHIFHILSPFILRAPQCTWIFDKYLANAWTKCRSLCLTSKLPPVVFNHTWSPPRHVTLTPSPSISSEIPSSFWYTLASLYAWGAISVNYLQSLLQASILSSSRVVLLHLNHIHDSVLWRSFSPPGQTAEVKVPRVLLTHLLKIAINITVMSLN